MLKKWLTRVGIGSAKVDTQLESDKLIPGEEIRGKVVIEGGNADQQVDKIDLLVRTEAVREKDDRKVYEEVTLVEFAIGESFTVKEGERKEVDFAFTLPVDIPPTLGNTKVWIQTGLGVAEAIDPKDRDFIEVNPHPYMETVLEALMEELGFRLRKVEMEYSKRYRYVQEFEFVPGSSYRNDLDELEAIFFMESDRIDVVLQVDRRAKGLGGLFAEALDMDENYAQLSFTKAELAEGTSSIARKIQQRIQ